MVVVGDLMKVQCPEDIFPLSQPPAVLLEWFLLLSPPQSYCGIRKGPSSDSESPACLRFGRPGKALTLCP